MGVLTSISRGLEAVSTPLGVLPDMVYAAAAVSFLLLLIVYVFVTPSWREKKRKRGRAICVWLMFAIYVLLILAVTILGKRSGDSAVDMGIFTGSWVMETLVKVAAGTVAFVPSGALIMILMKGKYQAAKSMGASFALALCVEILQLVLKTGVFDLGNLLFHTIGAGIGIVLVIFWKYAFSRKSAFSYAMRLMLSILIVLMLLETAAFGAYHVLRTTGQEHMDENISVAENQMISKNTDGSDAKVSSDPDVIWYNGKAYRYNHDLVTMLVMGIDQESDTIEEKDDVSGESGQADTIFLMVMDKSKDEIKMISISRDTMTQIKTFDYKGNYLGKSKNHLGLAYSFGDGKVTSCQYMVDAVSNLFYGMPINGYVALNMNAVAMINDAVGGVTVTVPEDMTQVDPSFAEGAAVTLTGDQALKFTRYRDTEKDFSNNSRMERQKQYLVNFMGQAVKAMKADMGLPVSLYQSLTDDMVTNLSLDRSVYLATEAIDMHFTADGIVSLKAKSKKGSVYDEVYVDDDALYDLIIQTFYTEEQSEGESFCGFIHKENMPGRLMKKCSSRIPRNGRPIRRSQRNNPRQRKKRRSWTFRWILRPYTRKIRTFMRGSRYRERISTIRLYRTARIIRTI